MGKRVGSLGPFQELPKYDNRKEDTYPLISQVGPPWFRKYETHPLISQVGPPWFRKYDTHPLISQVGPPWFRKYDNKLTFHRWQSVEIVE